MNRAVNGDIVVVEVFNEKEWRAPGDEVVDQTSELYLIDFLSVLSFSSYFEGR